jgi:hypothetical protein
MEHQEPQQTLMEPQVLLMEPQEILLQLTDKDQALVEDLQLESQVD